MKIKKSQFALFSYLSLILSFAFVLFLSINAYQKIENYKFNIENKYKEFYLSVVASNFEVSLLDPTFGFFFYHLFSFEKTYNNPFDFLFEHKGNKVSCSTLLTLDSNFYDKEYNKIKAYLEEKEKRSLSFFVQNLNNTLNNFFVTPWYIYFLNYLSKYKPNFENVQSSFLFFLSKEYKVNSFIVIKNKTSYLVNCYYRKYFNFKLPIDYPFGKEIEQIPVEYCVYHKITDSCYDLLNYYNRIYLDNFNYFLNYMVFETSLEDYSKDKSILIEDYDFLTPYLNPVVLKNLTAYGFSYLDKEVLDVLKNKNELNGKFWIVGNYLIVKNKSIKIFYLDYFQKKLKSLS